MRLLFPTHTNFLLQSIGLWLWVGPLCLGLVGLLYYLRNKYGLRLYFLE